MAEVEDLVQQTFMAAMQASARFRGEAGFRTFVLAIARNLLLKPLRDHRKLDALDPDCASLADLGLGASTVLQPSSSPPSGAAGACEGSRRSRAGTRREHGV